MCGNLIFLLLFLPSIKNPPSAGLTFCLFCSYFVGEKGVVATGEAKLLIGLLAQNLIQIELFLVSNVWSQQSSMRTLPLNPLQFKFTVRTSRDQIFSALQFERDVHGYPALNNCTE